LRLAPMAAVTNVPFRLVARECGAGRLTSEEIDARALVVGNVRTSALARFLPEEHPIAMQLLGADPDVLAEAARHLEAAGGDAITVHPRTRSQQFSGVAPWEIIARVVDAVAIPVLGNGDVRTAEDAWAMTRATGCAAVMIGRGALGAPWVFQAAEVSRHERARIIRRHCELIETHLQGLTALLQLKKHLAWYARGFSGAARLREALFALETPAAVQDAFWNAW